MGIPGPVVDTKLGEESRIALEGSHETGNFVGLLDQNADWGGAGSIGESKVAVETLDLGDGIVAVENAAVAADFAGSAAEVEKEVAAAPVGFELEASTKECRWGEHSGY